MYPLTSESADIQVRKTVSRVSCSLRTESHSVGRRKKALSGEHELTQKPGLPLPLKYTRVGAGFVAKLEVCLCRSVAPLDNASFTSVCGAKEFL